ncbi:MAG: hypothetical protein QM778_12240 [Myxococcales bacterium]
MRRQLEGFSYTFDDRLRSARADLTHSTLETQLRATALLAAELMELSESAQEEADELGSMRSQDALQQLADACFDVILEIDGERQDLGESMFEAPELQLGSRQSALRCAIKGLAALDQQIGMVFAD